MESGSGGYVAASVAASPPTSASWQVVRIRQLLPHSSVYLNQDDSAIVFEKEKGRIVALNLMIILQTGAVKTNFKATVIDR
jgi:hypothetical protein